MVKIHIKPVYLVFVLLTIADKSNNQEVNMNSEETKDSKADDLNEKNMLLFIRETICRSERNCALLRSRGQFCHPSAEAKRLSGFMDKRNGRKHAQ